MILAFNMTLAFNLALTHLLNLVQNKIINANRNFIKFHRTFLSKGDSGFHNRLTGYLGFLMGWISCYFVTI